MKTKRIIVLAICGCIVFSGCETTTLSSMQRRSIESRDLTGNFEDAFKATLAVLQDKGFIIDHTDFDAGVIKGTTGKKQDFWGRSSFNASITIEQFGKNNVKERIVFLKETKVDMGQYGTSEDSEIVDEPEFLTEIYEAIQKEMFVRQNLSREEIEPEPQPQSTPSPSSNP